MSWGKVRKIGSFYAKMEIFAIYFSVVMWPPEHTGCSERKDTQNLAQT